MQIKGNTFIVTGGASGLGEGTVHELVRLGANVSIFDIQGEKAAALSKTLGDNAFYPGPVDITSEDAVKSAVAATIKRFGKLSGVINLGGVLKIARLVEPENPDKALTLADFEHVLRVNLVGTLNVCKQVAAVLVRQEPLNEDGERGIIVNTTSITRNAGQAGQIAYAASKGGVAALTLPMARDLAPYGVRVVAIAPGVFQTPMSSFRRMTPEQVAATHELIAKVMFEFPRRMGQPSEYAKLVVQIVENPMLNGNIIRLDAAVRLGKGRLDYVVKLGKL